MAKKAKTIPKTTIQIDVAVRERLKTYMHAGQSDAIKVLLDSVNLVRAS